MRNVDIAHWTMSARWNSNDKSSLKGVTTKYGITLPQLIRPSLYAYERYRSGDLPSPYPERVAGVAQQSSGRTAAMKRDFHRTVTVNTALA